MKFSALIQNRRAFPAALAVGFALSHASALLAQGPAHKLSTPVTTAGTLPIDPSNVVRTIGDPATGHHWLLFRDPEVPGGPGLLVPGLPSTRSDAAATLPAASRSGSSPNSLAPVIHAGDGILLESHSTFVDTLA